MLPTPPLSGKNARNGNVNATGSKNAQNKENEEGDIFADPMSSSDDEDGAVAVQRGSGSLKENRSGNRNVHAAPPSMQGGFKQARGFNAQNNAKSGFRPPPRMVSQQSGGSGTSKRSASEDGQEEEDEGANSDDMVFSSQASSQQRKKARVVWNDTGAGRKPLVGNIHAPPTGARVAMRYGKRKVLTAKDRKEKKTNAAEFKTPKGLQAASEQAKSPPKFKFAKGADVFTFGQGEDEAQTGEASDDPSKLSELSSAESEVEEIDPATLNLPAPKKYTPTTDCGVCGARVPLTLKQEFEIRYSLSKALTYKWQQRFCRFHKVEAAKVVWVERGYPHIEWNKLDERLREHHGRLVAVLEGKEPSPYRARLQKVLDSGTTRTAMKAFNATAGTTSTTHAEGQEINLEIKPGYYGPRGEKFMTEHILSHFSARLRELALSDPLIKASGVAGGISGFVQAVLVPELAVCLVEGDLGVDAGSARSVLAESLEVGELLNEEVDERVERGGEWEVDGG